MKMYVANSFDLNLILEDDLKYYDKSEILVKLDEVRSLTSVKHSLFDSFDLLQSFLERNSKHIQLINICRTPTGRLEAFYYAE